MRWADVAARFPHVWESLTGQALALRLQHRADVARSLLLTAVERFPTVAGPHHDLARLEEGERNWAEAERWWRAFLALGPAPAWAYTSLARTLIEQRQPEQAEWVFIEAMAALPDDPEVLIASAQHTEAAQDWPRAAQRWGEVCQRFPEQPIGPVGHADALRASGDLDGAEAVLREALKTFPRSADVHRSFAYYAEFVGRRDDAAGHFRQAIALEPSDEWLYWHLSQIHVRAGAFALAQQALTDGLAAAGERWHLLLALAQLAESQKDWAEAVQRFRRCMDSFPDEDHAIAGYALALCQNGQHAEAEAVLTEAVARFPQRIALAAALARLPLLGRVLGRAAFVERARTVVEAFPDTIESYRLLGEALLHDEHHSDAEATLRAGIAQLGPDRSAAMMLATALVRQRKWEPAFEAYADLIANFPPDEGVYGDYVGALIAGQRSDQAEAVIREASARFPANASYRISLLDILIARDDLDGATALWRDLDAKLAAASPLRRPLFDRRGRMVGLGIDPADADRAAPAVGARSPPTRCRSRTLLAGSRVWAEPDRAASSVCTSDFMALNRSGCCAGRLCIRTSCWRRWTRNSRAWARRNRPCWRPRNMASTWNTGRWTGASGCTCTRSCGRTRSRRTRCSRNSAGG